MIDNVEQIKSKIMKEYQNKTQKSAKLFQEGAKYFPGGGTRNVANFIPYPFYATHGEGYNLYDEDGNTYIDCLNNMTSVLHGHAFPPIVKTLQEQASRGTVHAAPMEIQNKLAKIICDRVDSVDSVRFCNSGTEATMFALRGARVISNKNKILKFDGAYHGAHDYVETNTLPDYVSSNPPQLFPEKGFPPALSNEVLITKINDIDHTRTIIENHHEEIGAMIVEPVINIAGKSVTKEYIHAVRKLTEKYNIFLIFDEVITYRHALGGYQEILGVKPDFTAFGKIIGGGLPVGAFGGKRELMDWFNPRRDEHLTHSGTFSGNAMTVQAGIAQLTHYTQKEVDKLNHLGAKLCQGLNAIVSEINFPGHAVAIGSLVYFHTFAGDSSQLSMLEWAGSLMPTMGYLPYLNLALLDEGLYVYHKSCLEFILSTVMTEAVIDEILNRMRRVLTRVKPLFLKPLPPPKNISHG